MFQYKTKGAFRERKVDSFRAPMPLSHGDSLVRKAITKFICNEEKNYYLSYSIYSEHQLCASDSNNGIGNLYFFCNRITIGTVFSKFFKRYTDNSMFKL